MQELMLHIFIGLLVLVLGCSFAYKCFQAAVLGKMTYWSGFLPLSVFSPLFTHLPAAKNSLVKETSGLWVHLLMGPIFFIISILMLCAGADLVGLPGTDSLNYIINGGDQDAPLAVTYDKRYTFRFPFLVRAGTKLGLYLNNVQFAIRDKDRMADNPEVRAQEAVRQQEANRQAQLFMETQQRAFHRRK